MTRITFTGDLLAYKSLIKRSKKSKGYDFSYVFESAASLFDKSDYVVGNLETPLAGEKAGYTQMDMLFNTPDEFALNAHKAGFNMFTTANNHCMDKGEQGLIRTLDVLDNYGIGHTGTFRSPSERRFLIKRINGITFSFVSFTYGTNPNVNGYNVGKDNSYLVNITRQQEIPYKRPLIKQLLVNFLYRLPLSVQNAIHPLYPNHGYVDNVGREEIIKEENKKYIAQLRKVIIEAKETSDIVIVCLHSGGQFNSEIGEYTQYLIEEIKKTPADVLITNHPHCVLSSKWNRNNTFEAYSLGNFCFTPKEGYFIDGVYGEYGIVLHLDFEETSKSISSVSFSIIKNIKTQNGYDQVVPIHKIYEECSILERDALKADALRVTKRFLGREVNNIGIQQEYDYNVI